MRVKRNRQKTGSEPNYWQSYSDMMAALLLIFVLILALTLMMPKLGQWVNDLAGKEVIPQQ